MSREYSPLREPYGGEDVERASFRLVTLAVAMAPQPSERQTACEPEEEKLHAGRFVDDRDSRDTGSCVPPARSDPADGRSPRCSTLRLAGSAR